MPPEANTVPAQTETPEPQAPAPPAGPTQEELLAALDMERRRAAQIEQEALRMRASAEQAWTMHRQTAEPQEDPYKKVTQDLLVNPDEGARGLRRLIEQEADKKAQVVAQQAAQAFARQQQENSVAMSFNAFASRNPDLASPENQPRLAGAVLQADMEARRQGLVLPQDQLLERAARSLRAASPRPQQAPAYVEGGSAPSLQPGMGTPSAPEPQQSAFERLYKMDPGFIKDLPTPEEMVEVTAEYIRADNAEKAKYGIPTPRVNIK